MFNSITCELTRENLIKTRRLGRVQAPLATNKLQKLERVKT